MAFDSKNTSSAASPTPTPGPRPRSTSTIAAYLTDRHLFITGATGILAKVLVEKILFEQPDVGTLYLLIRAPHDAAANTRLLDLIRDSPVFDRLRARHGEQYTSFMSTKLVAVSGSLGQPGLGLSPAMLARLTDHVEVFINSAATTTFDER